MARENNFLLGNGERLTSKVKKIQSGGNKHPPYSFEKARNRISNNLERVNNELSILPDAACPNDEAVAILTMHPRYISKSDYPDKLLKSIGLEAIGSRSRLIKPEKWGTKVEQAEGITEDIFVAGKRDAFKIWSKTIMSWEVSEGFSEDLTHIEELTHFEAKSKLRAIPLDKSEVFLEVVLHNAYVEDVVLEFVKYAKSLKSDALINRRRDVKGLTFLPVYADLNDIEELAKFSFLRVARGMPKLRMFRPNFIRSVSSHKPELSSREAMDQQTKVVIFDGGLPKNSQNPLKKWVNYIEPPGISESVEECEKHGLAVTSALLFGPISEKAPLTSPLCKVDHVRVLEKNTEVNGDLMILDVLDRITNHLKNNKGKYRFINLSLGPQLAIDDDEINAWTAELDQICSGGEYVTTVAVGNDGELDEDAGLNRIQPPSDGVNMIAVGALDSQESDWEKAIYSCIGPGRCPGVIKPDGMAFGGSDKNPFGVLLPDLKIGGAVGTSFAAPFALRTASSVDVQLGGQPSTLAIRALMIHRVENKKSQNRKEVGWGKFETNPLRLITCEDDEALVIYQGELPISEYLRAEVPTPENGFLGMVELTATLVISPEVDPEFPGTYTRSGLTVVFRPNADKFKNESSTYADTKPFFSQSKMYEGSELEFRSDGHKWEPCLRHTQEFRAKTLNKPVFDIYYNHRQGGSKLKSPKPIPYSFIISLKAPKVSNLYNQLVRNYANILTPLRPQYKIQTQV